jgi:type IV pilus assembly protein PilA
MRPELQAKLLQHLNKKKGEQGFTLVELLVVIIIIGILTAIALPSFLNQAAKAKQVEAKNNVATILQAQQAWRTENPAFSTSFDQLALGIVKGDASSVGTNYNYVLATTAAANNVDLTAPTKDPTLKSYSGRLENFTQGTGTAAQIAWQQTICESLAVETAATTSNIVGIVAPGVGSATTKPACPATAKTVQ